jgi:hypothetical protein
MAASAAMAMIAKLSRGPGRVCSPPHKTLARGRGRQGIALFQARPWPLAQARGSLKCGDRVLKPISGNAHPVRRSRARRFGGSTDCDRYHNNLRGYPHAVPTRSPTESPSVPATSWSLQFDACSYAPQRWLGSCVTIHTAALTLHVEDLACRYPSALSHVDPTSCVSCPIGGRGCAAR